MATKGKNRQRILSCLGYKSPDKMLMRRCWWLGYPQSSSYPQRKKNQKRKVVAVIVFFKKTITKLKDKSGFYVLKNKFKQLL
jgi:hypothetical protein